MGEFPIERQFIPDRSTSGTELANRSTESESFVGNRDDNNKVEMNSTEKQKGIVAALLAGCCYGSNFLPSTFIQDNVSGASKSGLDYVFNQFCGILAGSTLYF